MVVFARLSTVPWSPRVRITCSPVPRLILPAPRLVLVWAIWALMAWAVTP